MTDPTATTVVTPDRQAAFSDIRSAWYRCSSPSSSSASPTTACARMLVLFLVAATTGANPGFGIDADTAGAVYGLYTGAVYLGCVARRLDRRPADRPAQRGVLGRRHHRDRQFHPGDSRDAGGLLPGPRGHRRWRRIAEAERLRHGRRRCTKASPARGATPASRSSTWASTSARSCRRWWPAPSAKPGTGAAASSAAACSCCSACCCCASPASWLGDAGRPPAGVDAASRSRGWTLVWSVGAVIARRGRWMFFGGEPGADRRARAVVRHGDVRARGVLLRLRAAVRGTRRRIAQARRRHRASSSSAP